MAYLNAEFARSVMDGIEDEFSRSSLYVRLVPVYVAAGAGVELELDALELREAFPRFQLLTALSREYALQSALADARRPLDSLRADEAVFAQAGESLLFRVLQQYVALFLIEDALALLAHIESPFLRARAFTAIGSARGAGGEFYSGPIVVP
ncbi:MAG: hypothetical protein EA428_00830 [Spirochaetaceae bacterium]|nr:MAG: hypothetical protein EA428_00830 [Spirochaetaceae bacterium]